MMGMDSAAEILMVDESIQPLIALPGWQTLQTVLVDAAKAERESMDFILDDLIEKNTPEDKAKWHESRVRYLSLIRAAGIFKDIRDAAYSAKQGLAEEEKISRKAEGSQASA